ALLSHASPYRPPLRSFPTRRSSDLSLTGCVAVVLPSPPSPSCLSRFPPPSWCGCGSAPKIGSPSWSLPRSRWWPRPPPAAGEARSEEHTSELQSRENLVCRLLLEKK